MCPSLKQSLCLGDGMFWLARSRAPVKGLGLPLSKVDILQRGRSGFSQKNKAARCACKPSRCPLWLFSDSFCSIQKHAKSLILKISSLETGISPFYHCSIFSYKLDGVLAPSMFFTFRSFRGSVQSGFCPHHSIEIPLIESSVTSKLPPLIDLSFLSWPRQTGYFDLPSLRKKIWKEFKTSSSIKSYAGKLSASL